MDKIHGSNLNKDGLTDKALSCLQTERKKKLKEISNKIKDDPSPIGLHKSDIDAIHQVFNKPIDIVSNTLDDTYCSSSTEHIKSQIPFISEMLEKHGKLSELRQLQHEMKLIEIYNTSPADIRAYNEDCTKRYNDRYTNLVRRSLSTAQETGSGQVWEAYTFVRAVYEARNQTRLREDNPRPLLACYHSEMLLDDGVFRVINATKKRPKSTEFQDRKKYPEGLFDEEVQLGDTKPLAHSQVIYNQMRITEQWAKKNGGYTGQFDLSKLEDKDIYEDTTRRMIEQFVKKCGKREFTAEDSGYKATISTPLGAGKWYLIHHHYENKAIVAVEMEIDDKGKYNIAYLIKKKS